MTNDINIQVVDWLSCESLRDIRRTVFIDEQRVPVEEEWDADDPRSVHFLVSVGDQAVGTARLLPDGHIGRVAIMRDWRGKGLGDRLMREVMQYAANSGMQILKLSAQTQALDFYRQLGFVVDSGEYLEAGIPHHRMIYRSDINEADPDELGAIEFSSPGRFPIHNPEEPVRPRLVSLHPQRLGVERDLLEIDEHNALQHACNLALQARRSLTIHPADQALWLFNQRDFIGCCEQLIASSSKARIRVLVHEVGKDLLSGHSLVRLMHSFASFCEVRRQHPDLVRNPQVYLLVDDAGILMLPKASMRSGFVRYNSPDQVKRCDNGFDELWSSSQTDPALRRFLL